MRIAYFTTDEVHADIVCQQAARHRIDSILASERDPLVPGHVDASIYDLDYLSAEFIARLVQALERGALDHPILAHGYAIPDALRESLRKHGVVLRRKLSRRTIALICRIARRRRGKTSRRRFFAGNR